MDRSLQEHGVNSADVVGFCFECHHEMVRSSEHLCPECGRWFDPDDPATSYRRKPGFLLRVVIAPPGLAWFLLTVLMCLLYMASESAPGGYYALGILATLCFTLLLLSFFGELSLHFIALWFCGRPFLFERQGPLDRRRVFRRRELMWFMPPLLVLAGIFLVRLDVPFRVAFLLSQGSLKEYVLSNPSDRETLPGWIGLFPVESVDGGVITLESGGMFEETGFVYVGDVSEAMYTNSLYKDNGGSTWQLNDEWVVFQVVW